MAVKQDKRVYVKLHLLILLIVKGNCAQNVLHILCQQIECLVLPIASPPVDVEL